MRKRLEAHDLLPGMYFLRVSGGTFGTPYILDIDLDGDFNSDSAIDLRDVAADLRQGRCYLPADKLAAMGLKPAALLQIGNESKFRPLYEHYLDLAAAHLSAGWAYTNTIPRSQVRVRLGCAWPILIGLETITRLRNAHVLDPNSRVKISRPEVRRIIASQIQRENRLAAADDVIDNSGSVAAMQQQVRQLHEKYLALAPV